MPITLPGDPPPNPKFRWTVPILLAGLVALMAAPFAVVQYHNSVIQANQGEAIKAMLEYAREQADFFAANKRYASSFEELGGVWAQVKDMRALAPTNYHGYRFRAFTSQSKAAQGGERNFVDAGGHMTGGYALIAVPIDYGYTGRMTFYISDPGTQLYYHDRGVKTDAEARTLDQYAVPEGWGL